jgi:hypothetical protein
MVGMVPQFRFTNKLKDWNEPTFGFSPPGARSDERVVAVENPFYRLTLEFIESIKARLCECSNDIFV